MVPIGARFNVVRSGPGGVVTLRPAPTGDEGLFSGEPSGSIQLGRLSNEAAQLLRDEGEVRVLFVPVSLGTHQLIPRDAVVLQGTQISRVLQPEGLTVSQRFSRLRLTLRDIPGSEAAIAYLEQAWIMAKLAQGEIRLEDPDGEAIPPATRPTSGPTTGPLMDLSTPPPAGQSAK